MRLPLLFTFALLLTACSDTTTETQTTLSSTTEKETTVETEVKTEAVTPVNENATAQKEEEAVNGYNIYVRKCASCHGQNGEKAALNKSQVITGWDKEKTVSALKGYQDGSYGSNMKAIMKGQASALNDAQIEAVSKHISTL